MADMQQTANPWFGKWLRIQRERSGISTAAIGKSLGVSTSTVLARERGGIITVDALPSVIAAYGITPQQIAAKLKEMAP